ncbi:50S ribosomal protein L23 [Planctomycetota bacterium]
MKAHEIIIKPLLTEKGTMGIEERNEYPFRVHSKANKIEIGKAVEKLFKVRVLFVRTMSMPGKRRRRGAAFATTSSWKKAIVGVHHEDSIDFV